MRALSRDETSIFMPCTIEPASSFSRRKNSSTGPVTSAEWTIVPSRTETTRASMRMVGFTAANAPVSTYCAPSPLPISAAVDGSIQGDFWSSISAMTSEMRVRSTSSSPWTLDRSVISIAARPRPRGSKSASLELLSKNVTASVRTLAAAKAGGAARTASSRTKANLTVRPQ